MSTWHPTTKAAGQPTHETVPIRTNQIRLNCGTVFHGGRRNGTNLNQDPPHQHPTPKRAEHIRKRAIWHRLFGTLLSSQGTDAHPSRPFNLSGGNRSNLAERPRPVKSPRQRRFSWGGTLVPRPDAPGDRRSDRRSECPRWSARGTSHCGSIRGVRFSVPGDIEKITQPAARRANPCPVTRVTSPERALTCANAQ